MKIDKIDRKNDFNINRVHMNQSIVGGILTYTNASNAYSKLLKGSTCKNVTSHLAKIEEKIFKKWNLNHTFPMIAHINILYWLNCFKLWIELDWLRYQKFIQYNAEGGH